MQMVKCMLVGDSGAGKTPLLITYISGSFPSEYVPTIFNCNVVTVMLRGESCSLELWDTSGLDAYDRLHPLIYPQKDVFLVCFSVVSPSSYERVREKWVPEINQHCPNTPFLLVGTMIDLRDDSNTLDRLAKDKQQPLSPKDGEKLAQELGAVKYVESSALTQRGLRNVFDEAILAALKPPNPPDTKSKTGCVLL